MSIFELILQGLRCLFMHRLRAFLSILGVLFGVVAVVAMMSIGEGSKQEILNQIEQLGTNNIIIRQSELTEENQKKALQSKSKGLSLFDGQMIEKNTPFIEKHAAIKVVKANVTATSKEISPEILAVTSLLLEMKGLSIAEGRFLCSYDEKKGHQVCVLGSEIAKTLGKQGHVGKTIRIENIPFEIVGILNSKNWSAGKTKALSSRNLNQSILIPVGVERGFPLFNSSLSNPLSEIILQVKKGVEVPNAVHTINRVMEFTHKGVVDYQIIVPQELLDQAYRTQDLFNLVLGSIAAISMLVGGIGIMNIMLASVSERTREIGIRRAIGANKFHIIKQFLVETLILTFLGATLGVIFGIIFSNVIGSFAGWNVVVTPFSIFLSLGMALGVGLGSGIYPAFKAAQMSPLVALRHL